jgi:hypothetical protein
VPSDDETEIARTTGFAQQAYLRLVNGKERAAAGLMFSAACAWSLSLGIPAKSLVDSLFAEVRRQEDETLD